MSEDLPLPTSVTLPVDTIDVPGNNDFVINVNSKEEFKISPNLDGAEIQIGGQASMNDIYLNGGIRHNVTTLAGGGPSYIVTNNDYIINVTSSAITTVKLPSVLSRDGKTYIIRRKFGGATALTVVANGAETIDGATTMNIPLEDMRLQLVSDGVDNWDII